jgi:hypothetical protein
VAGAENWVQARHEGFLRDVAAGGDGTIWVADTHHGIYRLLGDTLEVIRRVYLGPGGVGRWGFIGAALDADGFAWAIDRASDRAFRIDPDTYAATAFPVGRGPYTYSDMTGYQLRGVAPANGRYRHRFAGCGERTTWESIAWEADVGPDALFVIRARGARPPDAPAAPYATVATVPPARAPVALAPALAPAGHLHAGALEVEVELRARRWGVTPVLRSLTVTARCAIE